MPQLGLGLGLHKGSLGLTPLSLLKKYTSAMWLPSKATGTSPGINSPFTNPMIDLKGVVGKNLFDAITVDKTNKYIDVNGNKQTSSPWWSSEYTPINSSDDYTITGLFSSVVAFVAFYDVNKIFISSISNTSIVTNLGKITTPSNAKFIRFSSPQTTNPAESIMLNEGTTALPYEPYGKANLLLNNFAGTSASGYVDVLCPNGKTVRFLKFDGIDDYANGDNPSLEILGTSDFGFGKFAIVPTSTTRYLLSKAEQSEATTQYALKITNTGILSIILEGTTVQLVTGLLINTMYSIWVERISGVLKCFINGVEVFSVANTTSLTTRPNFRVGAMSTNVGGTTHTGFSNASVGALVISKTDVLKARQSWFNFTLKTFGL